MAKPTKSATKPTQEEFDPGLPAKEPTTSSPPSRIDNFVRRRSEVARKDHAEFQVYLRLKEEDNARKGMVVPVAAVEEKRKSRMSRRMMLNVAVGTAGAAEVAVLGHKVLTSGSVSDQGLRHAGANSRRRATSYAKSSTRPPTSGGKASATGSQFCRPRWAAERMRSTSIPTECWGRSGTGTTATTMRSAIIFALFPARIRCTASSLSTVAKAARTR